MGELGSVLRSAYHGGQLQLVERYRGNQSICKPVSFFADIAYRLVDVEMALAKGLHLFFRQHRSPRIQPDLAAYALQGDLAGLPVFDDAYPPVGFCQDCYHLPHTLRCPRQTFQARPV